MPSSLLSPCALALYPGCAWVPVSRAVSDRPAASRPCSDGSLCWLFLSALSSELTLVAGVYFSALLFSSLPFFPQSPFMSLHLFVPVLASVLAWAFSQCSGAFRVFLLVSSLDFVSLHLGWPFLSQLRVSWLGSWAVVEVGNKLLLCPRRPGEDSRVLPELLSLTSQGPEWGFSGLVAAFPRSLDVFLS